MFHSFSRVLGLTIVAMLLLTLAAGSALAEGKQRSQSNMAKNDACKAHVSADSSLSYRVDWSSYFDGTDTWWGYVESADNTGSATLAGVDVFATTADLAGNGSMDPEPPDTTVSVDSADGDVLGVVGFHGRNENTDTTDPFELDTYMDGRAMGSFTVCMEPAE